MNPPTSSPLERPGIQHPPTQYVAGRITSKNRQEFVKGRWTARLRVPDSGQDGMFPAWWLLGARNDEPPIEDVDETVCWPMTGSGEIDVFEHHSEGARITTPFVASRASDTAAAATGSSRCTFRPPTWRSGTSTASSGKGRICSFCSTARSSEGQGDDYPEPLFGLLNFAKINASSMTAERWTMEVDWVKHGRRVE